jgi:hypothetical protein
MTTSRPFAFWRDLKGLAPNAIISAHCHAVIAFLSLFEPLEPMLKLVCLMPKEHHIRTHRVKVYPPFGVQRDEFGLDLVQHWRNVLLQFTYAHSPI